MTTQYRTNRSRIYKKLENRSKKSLIINVVAIIVILFLLLKFGIPLLVNFTLFISGSKKDETSAKTDQKSFVAPPILDPMPEATNSADVVISGIASTNQSISLFVNNTLVDQTKTKENGKFSFSVSLSEKENKIQAKAITNNAQSEFSEALNISVKNSTPILKIENPSDGQTFSKDQNNVEVKGETDPQVKVTVNDFWAISDQNNKFSYNLPLKNGDNTIKIVAIDNAGNKTEKEIKVSYNP